MKVASGRLFFKPQLKEKIAQAKSRKKMVEVLLSLSYRNTLKAQDFTRISATLQCKIQPQYFGNVQKCVHEVGRDCEAHFLKTLSKPNAAGGQIDTVSQKRC